MATNTGMEVENIRYLFAWSNVVLKAELRSQNVHFNSNANIFELVGLVIADMLRIRAVVAAAASRD